MASGHRHVARSAAFVGRCVALVHPERESGIMIEEERGNVIVVDHEQHIDALVLHPLSHLGETFEDRRPGRIVLLARILRESNCG